MNFRNKLECLCLASISSLVYCLFSKPGAYLSVEHLKYSSVGSVLALLTNIRQRGKGLTGTNTLVYFKCSQITAVKSFIVMTPDVNVIKLFSFVADDEAK